MDMARPLLIGMTEVRYKLWAEAVNSACYISNRLVTRSTEQDGNQYKIIYGRKPNVEHLRRFGKRACVYTPSVRHGSKFDKRS